MNNDALNLIQAIRSFKELVSLITNNEFKLHSQESEEVNVLWQVMGELSDVDFIADSLWSKLYRRYRKLCNGGNSPVSSDSSDSDF